MGFFKKIVNNYIDRVGKKIQKKDPSINRLKKKTGSGKTRELFSQLIQ